MPGTWDALDPTYNEMTPGSVAPSGGFSVAAMATGANKRMVTASGSNSPGAPAPGAGSNVAPAGSFVGGMIVFLVLVLVVMFVAHKFGGDDGDFKNIKASAYNVIFVALVAVTGIPVIKVALFKLSDWNVPGAASALQWAKAA
jgi:hypothetical protein